MSNHTELLDPAIHDQLLHLKRLRNALYVANYPLLVLGGTALILNLVLIWLTGRLLRLHRLSWKRFYLIFNNGIMDACVSLIIIISRSVQIVHKGETTDPASMLQLIESTVVITPALYFLSLSFIQYMAIRYPLVYATRVTKRMCRLISAVQWCAVIGYGSAIVAACWIARCGLGGCHSATHYLTEPKLAALHRVKQVHESIMITLLVFFIVAVSTTYTMVAVARIKRVRGIERTLDQFVRNFGVNVIVYVVAAIAVLIISIMQLPASAAYVDVMRRREPSQELMQLLTSLSLFMRLQAARFAANFIWLSRLVLEPLLHIYRNIIIKRYLMTCFGPYCKSTQEHHIRAALARNYSATAAQRTMLRQGMDESTSVYDRSRADRPAHFKQQQWTEQIILHSAEKGQDIRVQNV